MGITTNILIYNNLVWVDINLTSAAYVNSLVPYAAIILLLSQITFLYIVDKAGPECDKDK